MEKRGASFGLGVLVALGWYATVVGAVVVGESGVPVAPDRDCSAMFSCLSPAEGVVLLLIAGAPVLFGLLVGTVVLAALLARWIRSAILVGTLSAGGSLAIVALVGLAWRAGR
ncbi:hypothetical protein [Asanoa siamensis]|uniref:Uncharacterized protein n=1 Tax=Asanoa siamensis TaxID=926357 RepID=A0ABQ4D3Z3_9ACTN|nr:hypothetical protein [Asanoa siamensis]GIF78220.1 hypothetical protein Asi02nite_77380 [Asanoa siamensis]